MTDPDYVQEKVRRLMAAQAKMEQDGWKTTEFWLAALPMAVLLLLLSIGGYAISRGMAK